MTLDSRRHLARERNRRISANDANRTFSPLGRTTNAPESIWLRECGNGAGTKPVRDLKRTNRWLQRYINGMHRQSLGGLFADQMDRKLRIVA